MARLFASKMVYCSVASMLLATVAACTAGEKAVPGTGTKSLREHEEAFDPSAYRREADKHSGEGTPARAAVADPSPEWIERTEKVMGFRVQLYSTPQLDEAEQALTRFRSRFDSLAVDPGRLDMGYDAPYYKVRAGDFLDRAGAEEFRERLREADVPEAWIVRDTVFRVVRERKK